MPGPIASPETGPSLASCPDQPLLPSWVTFSRLLNLTKPQGLLGLYLDKVPDKLKGKRRLQAAGPYGRGPPAA